MSHGRCALVRLLWLDWQPVRGHSKLKSVLNEGIYRRGFGGIWMDMWMPGDSGGRLFVLCLLLG